MDRQIITSIIDKAMQIGVSSKHFVSADATTHVGAFPVTVYVHELDHNGFSIGVVDSLDLSTDMSFELHKGWFDKWADIVAKERESDDTHRLR